MPARGPRLCASAAAVAAVTGAALLSAAGPAAAASRLPSGCTIEVSTVTCAYSYTGGEQVFLVPPRVTSIEVSATGASGQATTGTTAGAGATVAGTLTVVPGTDLYIDIGGPGAGGLGGFNGGGNGTGGGGGGGATDLRTVPMAAGGTLASRLLVAGGGGGGGHTGLCFVNHGTALGGSGGDASTSGSAVAGGSAALCTDATGATGGGGGGTLVGGGAAGTTTVSGALAGAAGALGTGAAGPGTGGGGGGGGDYGGGSGAGSVSGPNTEFESSGGGGGGSSLVPAGGAASVATVGTPGSLTITYQVPSVIADVKVSISGPHKATGGARFTELITVTNNGPDQAFEVTTSLNIPSHLGLLWAPHATIGAHTLWWNDSVLASGASVTYRATFRPGSRFRGGAEFRAAVVSGGSSDPDLSNNKATYWVRVTPPAARALAR